MGREDVNRRRKGRRGGVSFSGLLNALDGVRSQEGRILFMTTNHKEKLDPALLRPGRADVHVELCNATFSMIKELFLKFYPNEEHYANEFAKKLPERKLSMAKLQGHFLRHRGSALTALEKYKDLLKEEETVPEMTVDEWLDRMNLSKYLPMFSKNQCYMVNDIALHLVRGTGKLNENFKFKDALDDMRINIMIRGRDNGGKIDF